MTGGPSRPTSSPGMLSLSRSAATSDPGATLSLALGLVGVGRADGRRWSATVRRACASAPRPVDWASCGVRRRDARKDRSVGWRPGFDTARLWLALLLALAASPVGAAEEAVARSAPAAIGVNLHDQNFELVRELGFPWVKLYADWDTPDP